MKKNKETSTFKMLAPSLLVILPIFALIPRLNAVKNARIRSFDEGL